MRQSELDYKKETGLASSEVKTIFNLENKGYDRQRVYNDQYIEWLEERYETLSKQVDEMSMDWKSEYDYAVDEIKDLNHQIDDLNAELRDLEYEFRSRT